jgi:cytoskeletal protein CcmA (bactofilin family)
LRLSEGAGSSGNTVELTELNEDLIIEHGARVVAAPSVDLVRINGDVKCTGDAEFVGKFECRDFTGDEAKIRIGSLTCKTLEIRDGDIEVAGDLVSNSIEVDHLLIVRGSTRADDIEVGGQFEANGVRAHSVNVGGRFRAQSRVDVEDIDVGGTCEISGEINSRSLDVGGRALLSGGTVSGSIDIGGTFESNEPLNFGSIEVGGVVNLKGPSSGGDIEVGGRLRVYGDISFKTLEIGGIADITGNASGQRIEIGGRLEVGGNLKLDEDLEVGGEAAISGDVRARSVEVGGRMRALSLWVKDAEFAGSVRAEHGIYASQSVEVSRGSRVEGWIRAGGEVTVESRAQVESVSARRVTLEDRCRAVNVYAEDIEISDRTEISGEVLYTRSINFDSSVRFAKRAVKVDEIPVEKGWQAPT